MMQHSESIKELATALAAAQGEIENAHKNAKNPHFKSSYADLAQIINTVRPVLSKHGLSVVQIPAYSDGVVTVETMLLHKSGEWLRGDSGAPAAKLDPQGVGSATTYLRRYSLAAVCGIAQEDDDGEAASRLARNGKAKQEPAASAQDLHALREIAAELGGKASDYVEQQIKTGLTMDAADTLYKKLSQRKAQHLERRLRWNLESVDDMRKAYFATLRDKGIEDRKFYERTILGRDGSAADYTRQDFAALLEALGDLEDVQAALLGEDAP